MNIDLTPILQAVIAIIAALVTYKLIPWIKARTTNEQQAYLKATVRTLVFAAEQIYGAGNGSEKYRYVVNALKKRGFSVDAAAIEAAVNENFSHFENTSYNTQDVAEMNEAQIRDLLSRLAATSEQIAACTDRKELEALISSYAIDAEPEPPTQGGAE